MGYPRSHAPLVRALPLAGRALRHACLAVLADAGRPLSLAELSGRLGAQGFTIAGCLPHKTLSDALRWEVGRGRVARVARGRYGIGRLPRSTATRVRSRLRHAVDGVALRDDVALQAAQRPAGTDEFGV